MHDSRKMHWGKAMNAYRKGVADAIAEKGIDANPYPANTQQWVEWRLGYNDTKGVV